MCHHRSERARCACCCPTEAQPRDAMLIDLCLPSTDCMCKQNNHPDVNFFTTTQPAKAMPVRTIAAFRGLADLGFTEFGENSMEIQVIFKSGIMTFQAGGVTSTWFFAKVSDIDAENETITFCFYKEACRNFYGLMQISSDIILHFLSLRKPTTTSV